MKLGLVELFLPADANYVSSSETSEANLLLAFRSMKTILAIK
jgi:hypothetical protein